jgi:hypothetical protein
MEQRPFNLNKHSELTTMAPPKQVEASHATKQPRVRTKAWIQLEEGEKELSEIINGDEIPSPDTTLMNPTPMVEEAQKPTLEGMNIDMPTETQEKQN